MFAICDLQTDKITLTTTDWVQVMRFFGNYPEGYDKPFEADKSCLRIASGRFQVRYMD